MVFNETLFAYEQEVREAVEELFTAAYKNQKVDTDLLLVITNGFHNRQHLEFYKTNRLSPYVIGPDQIGHSLQAFYDFFHTYRLSAGSKKQFLKMLKKPKKKEEMLHNEEIAMNIELLIFLKFWESDLLLRQLYNLVNLATGQYYDWETTPPDLSNPNKQNPNTKFSRRPFIRNQIQAPIKTICPKFYKLVDENYSNQIRNAIAHSKYYFSGRTIHLANKDENPHYTLTYIPFDEWEIRFHKVILFYNFIIGSFTKYNDIYAAEVVDKHFGLPVSTPRLNHLGLRKNQWVKYDRIFKRWLWSTQVDD